MMRNPFKKDPELERLRRDIKIHKNNILVAVNSHGALPGLASNVLLALAMHNKDKK
jgi:hypothetical protein